MRLLLDTHIAMWAVVDDPKLPASARDLISDTDNEVMISVASLWEIAIKHALAHGSPHDMPLSAQQARGHFRDAGYGFLEISPAHVVAVETLPSLHADPFDRILVAQALVTPLRLLNSRSDSGTLQRFDHSRLTLDRRTATAKSPTQSAQNPRRTESTWRTLRGIPSCSRHTTHPTVDAIRHRVQPWTQR